MDFQYGYLFSRLITKTNYYNAAIDDSSGFWIGTAISWTMSIVFGAPCLWQQCHQNTNTLTQNEWEINERHFRLSNALT